ncbi:hypothetical protein [Streptomyces sp. DH24]|uniref:hypothetical protein n=1 Tax=Streptomyces sp. DH24 TaxID=3040123 RepID=UPI0024418A24|nr:hypothetical protein [Streptomyces sp. DH24]MDG9716129.1 hypothetical protein [Streptomyces sp. DH24]
MTFGDHGSPHGSPYGDPHGTPYGGPYGTPYGQPGPHPYGAPDPHAQWAAAQERIRRGRRLRRVAGGTVGLVLVAAIGVGVVLATGGGGDTGEEGAAAVPSATGDAAPSVAAELPSGAPSALPSLLARPVIRPERAFPEKSVRLSGGARYERVDLATTTDCARGMSPGLAQLVEQGEECLRLTAALFTDAERRSQVTVTVLSFERVEDASRVMAMASMDPVSYQVVSLDPPPGAGLPTVPPGSAGVFRRVMTVRSVVFANGQWGDGAETGEAALTGQTEDLLQYVNDRVAAYEQGEDGA